VNTAKRVTWDEISLHVTESMRGEEAYFSEAIKQGECQAWRFNTTDIWMITRSEKNELVICCIEGKGLNQVAPQIIEVAKQGGFESIRFHTKRPALGRILARHGFNERERIYSLEF